MEWKEIKWYEGLYSVSTSGNVRRERGIIQKSDGTFMKVESRILKASKSTGGYRSVRLSKNGKSKAWLIHVLVWAAFGKSEKTKGLHIDHIDENKTNNSIENLQLLTHRQNNVKSKLSRNPFTGACFDPKRKKYVASIYRNGKSVTLGRFETKELAHERYKQALFSTSNNQ